MAWIKKNCRFAQEEGILNILSMVNDAYSDILNEYFRKGRKKGSKMSWSVVPFGRLRKIWEDYAKFGFVRDEAGLNQIYIQILRNLARIQAATDLAGHGTMEVNDIVTERGFKPIADDNTDFYFEFINTAYGTPISDFGLPQLWNLAEKLTSAKTSEEKLVAIDRMLNVVHQRGDLAALFVEGGIPSLSQLSERDEKVDEKDLDNKEKPPKTAQKDPSGTCYKDVVFSVVNDDKVGPKQLPLSSFDELVIVHGKATVDDVNTGKQKIGNHAWIEFNAGGYWFVYDPTKNLVMDKQEYYRRTKAKSEQRYDKPLQLVGKSHQTGHYGPYSDEDFPSLSD
jgi:hypothetical protein